MEEKLVKEPIESKRKHLKRINRLGVFAVFWVILLCNCSDSGIPSAASNHFKKDIGLNDTEFGKLGSILQIGRITGTFIVIILLKLCNRKYLLFVAVSLKCCSYIIYLFTSNIYILYCFRIIQGCSHVFAYNYYPTWTDQFGIRRYKTILIAVMQNASPIGSVFGFGLCNTLGTSKVNYIFNILLIFIYSGN